MRVATIGSDPLLDVRRNVLNGIDGIDLIDVPQHRPSGESLKDVDAMFIAVPRSERFRFAAQAARLGTHVFVEWPPATSIRECAALVRLAEESGVECAVSRPLRFTVPVHALAGSFRANIVSLTFQGAGAGNSPSGSPTLTSLMADAVDLSCALVKSSSVRRVDAEAARDETSQPEAVMFSLRFHSGAYAHVFINLNDTSAAPELYAAGSSGRVTGPLSSREAGIRRETIAFVDAVGTGHPAPVATLDALHTMRIVERLQALLR